MTKQEIHLPNGARAILEFFDDVVTFYTINAAGIATDKTCTCTCPNGTSQSKTCPANTNNTTCDCTGSSARMIC